MRDGTARRRTIARWTASVAAAAAIAALGVRLWVFDGVSNYATAVGEQRSVKLADGSIMMLNTRSRAEVNFATGIREIRLREGEALFEVVRDPARPFRVVTSDAVAQAVGTQFNVRRNTDATVVSVVEGSVRVSAQNMPQKNASPIDSPALAAVPVQLLIAGEKAAVARNGSILKQTLTDASEATVWRQRRLIFRENELTQVAAEFNRYNEVQIRIEGEGARRKVLTGAFNADNPRGLILFLRQDPSLQIDDSGRSVAIRQR